MHDGRWGSWSVWTNCTRVCGGGLRTRHRFCNNPTPAHGGQDCVGNRIQTANCNTERCPGNLRTPASTSEISVDTEARIKDNQMRSRSLSCILEWCEKIVLNVRLLIKSFCEEERNKEHHHYQK